MNIPDSISIKLDAEWLTDTRIKECNNTYCRNNEEDGCTLKGIVLTREGTCWHRVGFDDFEMVERAMDAFKLSFITRVFRV
ncbi:MAG: hypothetical protein GY861_16585 [bacterium]|nr:hypothetical protein [bacterium]